MLSVEDLEELRVLVRAAPPCHNHGVSALAVCIFCRETIRCAACNEGACLCMHDA
jgi:hypothetical protein